MHNLNTLRCKPSTLYPESVDRCKVSRLLTRPDAHKLKTQLKINAEQFADLFGVSPSLAHGWMNGTRKPIGAARKLLLLVERNPALIEELKQI